MGAWLSIVPTIWVFLALVWADHNMTPIVPTTSIRAGAKYAAVDMPENGNIFKYKKKPDLTIKFVVQATHGWTREKLQGFHFWKILFLKVSKTIIQGSNFLDSYILIECVQNSVAIISHLAIEMAWLAGTVGGTVPKTFLFKNQFCWHKACFL